jgi:hypothetical protein
MSAPNPSHERLIADLENVDLRSGIESGRWRILECDEQALIVQIRVAESENYFAMKLDVVDYPAVAPAGVPWDLATGDSLPIDQWPTWPRPDMAFRKDWSPSNGNAPYFAWDRVGLATHPDWAVTMAGRAWHPGRTILHYLRETEHELESAVVAMVDA